jgi:VIT1/CCC1 family predicted Fe2+/Mn2+ transporter
MREIFRHYIRDLVYGANDGIITTFAVVAGVAGGALSPKTVLIVGIANIVADGLSMGVGNYLGIRSEESARAREELPEAEAEPARHGVATFLAFVAAGLIPLVAYVVPDLGVDRFVLAAAMTLLTLFAIGAMRAAVTVEGWLASGLEMLGLGVLVASAAYASGAIIAALVA